MKVQFRVEGRPPKGHTDRSMWSKQKDKEARLVGKLRQAALQAMRRAGQQGCFQSCIGLELILYVPRPEIEKVGDLDYFVTGVCDALQRPHPNVREIHPCILAQGNLKTPLLIDNDAKVVSIRARKEGIPGKRKHYRVVVREVEKAGVTPLLVPRAPHAETKRRIPNASKGGHSGIHGRPACRLGPTCERRSKTSRR